MDMRRLPALTLALLPLLPLAACGDEPSQEPQPAIAQDPGRSTSADLLDPDGAQVGTVTLSFGDDVTQVEVQVTDLAPGFHGFHLHETGECAPDSASPSDPTKTGDFLSAGGHLATEDQEHGEHAGDLPSLLVGEDGTASLTFTTDRVSEDDVLDEDGTAVMVHADPDNFANIPERYAPQGPDEATLSTGDAGSRAACAAVTAEG